MKSKFISMVLKFGKVASLAEAWIEIGSRERRTGVCRVASLAEAWIEIYGGCCACPAIWVASLAEAWIEIWAGLMCLQRARTSPPSRRRGLKYGHYTGGFVPGRVASLAEAWIEISYRMRYM